LAEQVLVIGGGPAGLATGVQLTRLGLACCVFEGAAPGGLLHNANLVENYPGFPQGIRGPQLCRRFAQQARRVGVRLIPQAVTELSFWEGVFTAVTPAGTYTSLAAVIATGTQPVRLTGVDLPAGREGRVQYEVYPLRRARGRRVVIVGAGDAAFDYALNLGRKNSVIILNRGTQRKCLPLLWERTQACPRIEYRSEITVTGLSAGAQGGLTVECSSPTGATYLAADYLLGALGRTPQLDFVAAELLKQAPMLEQAGILHLVGDVKNGIFRQTAIAVGDGILAAMQLHQYFQGGSNASPGFHR
jgi:thioredoxin reductase